MTLLMIIFMIVATVFALASLAYVSIDLILEHRGKKESVCEVVIQPEPEPVIEEIPVEESIIEEPEEQMPEIVEHIDAIEADEMISDNLAMSTVMYESPAGHGKQGIVNIGLLSRMFDADDVITLSVLKEKGIVHKNIGRLKVLADGVLDKPFTIKAESYSIQAIKMIELTGGKVIILKD